VTDNPGTYRRHFVDLRQSDFLWFRYPLGRWSAAVAPEFGDQVGFLLNIKNLTGDLIG
jgi:hypothetical protein